MPAIITIGEISRTLFKDNPSFEELKEKEAALSEEAKKSSEIGDEKAKDSHREVVALPPTLQEIVQEESKEEAIELYVKQAADHVIDLEKLDEVESLLLEEIKLWTNYCTRRVDEEFGESQYIKETIEQHIKQTLDRIVAALKSNHTKQEIAPSSTKRLLKGFEKSSQLRKYLISKVYPSGLPADSLNLSLLMKDISDYCFMLLKSKPEIQNKLLTIFPNSLTKEDLNCEEGVRTRLNEATKSLQNNDSQESLIRQAHERVIEKHAPRVLALETFPGHFRGDVHAIDALRYLLGEVDKTSHFGKAYYFNIPHKDASEIYFQYSADMNEAIIAIEKERHYKRALEKKDEIIKYLMTHPMYKKDGTQIYYDEQENSYRKEGNKIYRLDGNEELFFVQEDDKKRCYYLGTDSNKVYLPISNPGEITPFIPLFETFLKALGLQLPNPNKLVDDEYMNWLPELKLQSGKFEEAFKECDFTPSITVQNPLFVEAVTDLKLMPTEDDFTRSTEVVSSVTFPDSLTSKHAAQSFGYLVRADSLGNRQAASRILHILTRALSLLKVEEELSLTKRNSYHIFSFSGMQFIDFIFSITSDQEYLTSETNILGIFQQSIETLKKIARSLKEDGLEDASDNLESTILKAKDFLSIFQRSDGLTSPNLMLIILAIKHNKTDIVEEAFLGNDQALVKTFQTLGIKVCEFAAQFCNIKTIEFLLEQFPKANKLNIFAQALNGDNQELAEYLVTRDYPEVLEGGLKVAAHHNNIKTAKMLLDKDVDINYESDRYSTVIASSFPPSKITALGLACHNGRKEMAELLLRQKGIDVNKGTSYYTREGDRNYNTLNSVLNNRRPQDAELVETMLSKGCFLNSEEGRWPYNPYKFFNSSEEKIPNGKLLKRYEIGFNAASSASLKIRRLKAWDVRIDIKNISKHRKDSFKYLLEKYGIDDVNKLSILTAEDVKHALGGKRPESFVKETSGHFSSLNDDGLKADSDKVVTYAIAKNIITNIRRKKGESRFSPTTRSHKEEVRKATNILHNQLMQFVKENRDLSKDLYKNIENTIEDDLVAAQTTTLSRKNFRIGKITDYIDRLKALLPVDDQGSVDRKNNIYRLAKLAPARRASRRIFCKSKVVPGGLYRTTDTGGEFIVTTTTNGAPTRSTSGPKSEALDSGAEVGLAR